MGWCAGGFGIGCWVCGTVTIVWVAAGCVAIGKRNPGLRGMECEDLLSTNWTVGSMHRSVFGCVLGDLSVWRGLVSPWKPDAQRRISDGGWKSGIAGSGGGGITVQG